MFILQMLMSLELESQLIEYKLSKGFVSDVSKTEDSDRLVNLLINRNVNIDCLVNNVGISDENVRLSELDVDSWRKIYDTNVVGPMYLTKLVFERMMKEKGGNIIFLSSVHQDVIRRFPSYSASKGALKMAIQELALELAPYDIRVNGIAPGYTGEEEKQHQDTPIHGTSLDPKYIARGAVFLASDYFSRHTTGTVLKIDAGLSLVNHLFYEHPPEKDL